MTLEYQNGIIKISQFGIIDSEGREKMKYCPTCGTQISDSAAFCSECGTHIPGITDVKNTVQSNRRTGRKSIHCPECGSTNLAPIVESENNGGVAVSSPISQRMGMTSYSSVTTHRNYWVCQDCGYKFRNLDNLKEELTKKSKLLKPLLIIGILATVMLLLMGIILSGNKLFMVIMLPIMIPCITCDIIVWAFWVRTRREVENMTEEKRHLERHCFSK